MQFSPATLFIALDGIIVAALPQMEMYHEIGRLVSDRSEKGAAAAVADYLSSIYPAASGFSLRNLRRMRDFYRTYANAAEGLTIGWTQNVVILEAELTLQEKKWYIRAVQWFGWTKLELLRQIAASAVHHILEKQLDKQITSGI